MDSDRPFAHRVLRDSASSPRSSRPNSRCGSTASCAARPRAGISTLSPSGLSSSTDRVQNAARRFDSRSTRTSVNHSRRQRRARPAGSSTATTRTRRVVRAADRRGRRRVDHDVAVRRRRRSTSGDADTIASMSAALSDSSTATDFEPEQRGPFECSAEQEVGRSVGIGEHRPVDDVVIVGAGEDLELATDRGVEDRRARPPRRPLAHRPSPCRRCRALAGATACPSRSSQDGSGWGRRRRT